MPQFPKARDYGFMGLSPHTCYRILIWMINTLPESTVYWIARRLAEYRYFTDRVGREAVRHNLRLILSGRAVPGWEKVRLTREVFYQTGYYLAEFLGQRRFAAKFRRPEQAEIKGLQYIDPHLERGRGVLIISAHYSNWELGAAVMAARGYEVYVTSLEHEDPRNDVLFNYLRSVWGYHHMPINESVTLSIKNLRAGKVVCYLGDRPSAFGLTEAEFFGRREVFPVVPARMALKAGAAFVPGIVRRFGRNRFLVEFYPEIEPPATGTEKERAGAMVQRYVRWLEDRIREDPGQWVRYTPIGSGRP